MKEVYQKDIYQGGVEEETRKFSLGSSIVFVILLIAITLIFTRIVLQWGLKIDSPNTMQVPNPAGMVALVIVLALWNPLLGRMIKGLKLNRIQIFALYLAASTSAAFMFRWSQFAVSWFWYSLEAIGKPTANWVPLWNDIPSFIAPHTEEVLLPMLLGESTVPWGAWIGPIIMWTIFMAAVFAILFFTAELFRKRWQDEEHLTYPLSIPIQLLVDGTQEEKGAHVSSLKDKYIWIGLAIAIVWEGWIQLQQTFPWWPAFNPLKSLANTFSYLMYNFDPIMLSPYYWVNGFVLRGVGIAGFVPIELLFSVVVGSVFYMIFVRITGAISGWPKSMPYWKQLWLGDIGGPFQTFAGLTLSILMIWRNREHIVAIFSDAFGTSKSNGGRNYDGGISNKLIAWGLIASTIIIFLFLIVFLKAGLFVGLFFTALFVIEPIAYSRFRCEFGWASLEGLCYTGSWAQRFIVPLVGMRGLGPRNAIVDSRTYFLQIGTSSSTQIGGLVLEGYKMCEGTREGERLIPISMMASLILAVVASIIMALFILYRDGTGMYPRVRAWGNYGVHPWQILGEDIGEASDFWSTLSKAELKYIIAALSGVLFFVFASQMWSKFSWWRISPVGLILGSNAGGTMILTWIIRSIAIRWFGHKADKLLKKVFAGILIGASFIEFMGYAVRRFIL